MGRISELSDEERDTFFGRRLVKSFTGTPKETIDYWDQQRLDDHLYRDEDELEPLDWSPHRSRQ